MTTHASLMFVTGLLGAAAGSLITLAAFRIVNAVENSRRNPPKHGLDNEL